MAKHNPLSVEDVRHWQFSNSRHWDIRIQEDLRDPFKLKPDDLRTKFPLKTITISDFNIQSGDINANILSLTYPKAVTINSISLSFIDIEGDIIYNWFRNWRINSFDLETGASGLKDPGVTKLFTLIRLKSNMRDILWERSYLCTLADDPQFTGSSESGFNEYSVTLNVVGTGSGDTAIHKPLQVSVGY